MDRVHTRCIWDANAKWRPIIWRWHYKPEIDDAPRDIAPHCPDCERPTPLDVGLIFQRPKVKGDKGNRFMQCRAHKQIYIMPASWGPNLERYPDIKELVAQKLKDGSWVDVVNRQRAAKGMSPISVPQEAIAIAVPEIANLDEIAERILKALAWNGGTCGTPYLYPMLDHINTIEETPPLDPIDIQYYLDELEHHWQYITVIKHWATPGEITLTQAGRKYVRDHKLNQKPEGFDI